MLGYGCLKQKGKGERMKVFKVLYKFSDVSIGIEAETEEEARKIADERLLGEDSPQNDTYCYEMDIEEGDKDGD
jgi:hypothetical protein